MASMRGKGGGWDLSGGWLVGAGSWTCGAGEVVRSRAGVEWSGFRHMVEKECVY